MNKFLQVLKSLLPRGQAFNIPSGSNIEKLLKGFSFELERGEDFIKQIPDETNPHTTNILIDEWINDLKVQGTENLTVEEKRKKIIEKYKGIGCRTIEELKKTITDSGYLGTAVEIINDETVRCGTARCTDSRCGYDYGKGTNHVIGVRGIVFSIEHKKEFQRFIKSIIPTHISIVWRLIKYY